MQAKASRACRASCPVLSPESAGGPIKGGALHVAPALFGVALIRNYSSLVSGHRRPTSLGSKPILVLRRPDQPKHLFFVRYRGLSFAAIFLFRRFTPFVLASRR